ncbi:MAG TPA: hypothetical protein DEG17_20035 [Cyanobacteria bacterium UBA11149]|nr:hypothetical protein [Cyanobacteria bacterium UBA11367]HBE57260.1 hypothetical protein [Cyanobacteria bacterium UBA11366]HBR73637.1 hypothetical protein [Cyanobacteria bacterium UBA11159]HBS69196.1 hypothetical protein [Cyanobacteria bacterium UBA11153]HBW91088.1 hypothetical protein [Cyanobacteria bacterium UBA11149]HCA96548.1 hypothetical protein [Cyanobacteria bacterium UBA9226]
MNQEIRQKVVTLARELPDEFLEEALSFLHYLTEKAKKTYQENSSTIEESEFDKAMEIYQQGSEKYKNALRELA